MKIRVFSFLKLGQLLTKKMIPMVMVLLIAALVPTSIYFGYVFVIQSEHFALSEISVEGISRVEESKLLEGMSIFPGMNIFDVHSERAILSAKSYPWVKEIKLDIRYPDKIEIKIEEHIPVAIVDFRMGLMFVDIEGSLITEAKYIEMQEDFLPYLSGTSRLTHKDAPVVFKKGLELSEVIKKLNLGPVSELNYDENLGFTAVLLKGTEIRIGKDKFEQRLQRAKRVLAEDSEVEYLLVDHALSSNRVIVGHKSNAYQGR